MDTLLITTHTMEFFCVNWKTLKEMTSRSLKLQSYHFNSHTVFIRLTALGAYYIFGP